MFIFAEPLNDSEPVISPDIWIVLAVSKVVAVVAFPVKGPLIPAKVTLSPVPTL